MLSAETYIDRRQQLAETLGSSIAVFLGHEESPMTFRANPYPFRQESSFLYYFGIDAPGMAAMVDADDGRSILFGSDPTLDDIVWAGPQRLLAERGADAGVEDCRPRAEFESLIADILHTGHTVHYLPPCRDETLMRLASLLEIPSADVEKCASRELIAAVVAQRSIKSPEEVAEIEKALDLAREIHTLAMGLARPGMVEQEIVGAIEGRLIASGSAVAFPIIFSSRGEVLHNHQHDNVLKQGDLAILDAGALSPCYYASDITRTFPVGKRFSARQRQIYEIVLRAQQAAIEAVAPDTRFEEIHLLAAKSIAAGLAELGLLRGDLDAAVEAGAHALFFPHGLGHMMGLDVHDMESLGEDHVGYDQDVERSSQFGRSYLRLARRLEPGFVVTVEPGIYFIPQLIAQWRSERRCAEFIDYAKLEPWEDFGGVRIEDNILVTEKSHRLLGKPIPKSVDDVEQLCTQ